MVCWHYILVALLSLGSSYIRFRSQKTALQAPTSLRCFGGVQEHWRFCCWRYSPWREGWHARINRKDCRRQNQAHAHLYAQKAQKEAVCDNREQCRKKWWGSGLPLPTFAQAGYSLLVDVSRLEDIDWGLTCVAFEAAWWESWQAIDACLSAELLIEMWDASRFDLGWICSL